jgi:hypothetical protein
MKEIKCSRDHVDLARHALLKFPCIFQSASSHRNSSFTSQKAYPPLHSLNRMLYLILSLDSGLKTLGGKGQSCPSRQNIVWHYLGQTRRGLKMARSSSETGSPSTATFFRVLELFAALTRPLWSAIANFEVWWSARPSWLSIFQF